MDQWPTNQMSKLLIAAAVLSVCACSMMRNITFQRPELSLQSIELTGIGLSGGSLNLILDVYNPNAYDVSTMRIDAAVDLEGTHFGDVSLERDIVLASERHTAVSIPVSFTWAGVGAGARALLSRGEVAYELDSRLRVGTPIGEQTVSFQQDGVVPLRQLR